MRSPERREVVRLLSSLDVFAVTPQVGWQAAEFIRRYRRAHSGIGLGDYLVAATVRAEGLELATLNTKHFRMLRALRPPFRLPTG
jgi:hypothetical protein